MWPIGPSPFIYTDTNHFYRSLAKSSGELKCERSQGMDDDSRGELKPHGSLGLLVYRLLWMVIGPTTAVVTSLIIVTTGSGWLTRLDLMFLIAVLATLGARWASYLNGDLADDDGHPTTSLPMLRRYTFRLIPVAFSMWIVANLLGNHLLK